MSKSMTLSPIDEPGASTLGRSPPAPAGNTALLSAVKLALVLGIAAALFWDRSTLCRQYLFRYTDEDQTCMWYAAHDLLHGRIAEPAFYGQDYNSCMEGYLAAPLVALHVPYNIACPSVTVGLNLLPFVLLAAVACRRGNFLLAGAVLLVPLILSNRYSMICGISRGFINGVAVAAIPMILLLPPRAGARPQRFWRSAVRYFFAGVFAVVAFQVNPNCAILLAPVAVFALITRFLDWRMWVMGALGIAAAAPYPWYVHHFYHVLHPDYILYLRDNEFGWSYANFVHYLHFAAPASGTSPVFADFVPVFVPAQWACVFLLILSGALLALIILRLRIAAAVAIVIALGLMLTSFAYERVGIGEDSNTASYPYSRMWLAVPVIYAWVVFVLFQGQYPKLISQNIGRWSSVGTLAIFVCCAIWIAAIKHRQLPDAIDSELNADGLVICPAVPVSNLYAIAREVKQIADDQHADLLLVGGWDREKHVDYAIPCLIGIETIFPAFERRTFRMIEESNAHHQKIMVIFNANYGEPAGGDEIVMLRSDGTEVNSNDSATASDPDVHSFILPQINVIDAEGKSAYDLPELSNWLPQLIYPDPTPQDPHPQTQVYRPTWRFH
jgi:hypothetical protein